MEDNFYITLPSNVKSFFLENKISNYKTKLSSRIILPDEWEVGLVEISYTFSWYNLSSDEEIKLLYFENGEIKKMTSILMLEDMMKYLNYLM